MCLASLLAGAEQVLKAWQLQGCPSPACHSRSRGGDEAAHSVEASVSQVQALPGEFHPVALEVLPLKDPQLEERSPQPRAGVGWGRVSGEESHEVPIDVEAGPEQVS